MERAEVIAFLEEMEQKYPVNEWRSGDAQIWPIVKRDLFFKWFAPKKPIPSIRQSQLKKGMKLISSYRKWLLLKTRKVSPVDRLFVGAASHRVDWNNIFINRYYYPLIEQTPNKSYRLFEYGGRNEKEYAHSSKIDFIEDYLYANLFAIKKTKTQDLNIPEWERVMQEAQSYLEIDLQGYKSKLYKNLQTFWVYVRIFSVLFDKYKPVNCIGLCYYNLPMFALHYVANKRGVLNCDMQHGGQGSLHPMYHYSNPPKGGYNIVPQGFWSWDEASANNIKSWVNKQKFHQVFVKGNPWVEFQLNQNNHFEKNNKKIILYTIQEDKLDEYIVNAIQNTPDDLEWWLRLHPRMVYAKKEINQQLTDAGVEDKVIINKATSLPLPLILKHASVHISKFSGSIIEAAQIGTPSVIIDPIGVVSYAEYIDAGDAIPFIKKEGRLLLNTILKLIKDYC